MSTILQDMMGMLRRKEVVAPKAEDYVTIARFANVQERLKPQPKVITELITLTLVEESDTATAIAIRNKVLNTTVKGVPDIERVTLVQKDEEWVIQTTGSNIAKVLEVLSLIHI